MMKHIEVVAAIIQEGDKIFATQRGYGEWKDRWEFPGDLEVEKIYENTPNYQTKICQMTKRKNQLEKDVNIQQDIGIIT